MSFDPNACPLGFIVPSLRTQPQADAHARAMASLPMFTLDYTEPAGPVKVMLTDFWRNPTVIEDVGLEFNGFYQFTGSCVGVSEGNGIFTLGAIQRLIADNPTKALLPWWPFPYGRTRWNEGDRGQGEGAVVSIMGTTLTKEGVFDARQPGLPTFSQTVNGLQLTKQIEFQWSDGGKIEQKWKDLAQPNTLGTKAPLASPRDIKACIINGYPVQSGCSNFVGNGRIKGEGANAYVTGKYDGRGGHSTCFLGYWDHPTDGPLYLYSNQWPTSTYPKDPAGAGRCCVWLPETEIVKLFRTGGDDGETFGMSHLNYFPAQPKVLDWFIAP
jgi:hypothetical protein